MRPMYFNFEPKKEVLTTFYNRFMRFPWLRIKETHKELFMSEKIRNYQYETNGHIYENIYMNPTIKDMMKHFNESMGYRFNVCFLNLYDNHLQNIDWRADDDKQTDQDHAILIANLGAEREIWWKEKHVKGEIPSDNKQILENGSLFIMPAGFQKNHFYKLPKHYQPCGPSISLSFRKYKD